MKNYLRFLLFFLILLSSQAGYAQINNLGPCGLSSSCTVASVWTASTQSSGTNNAQVVTTNTGDFRLQAGNAVVFVPGSTSIGPLTLNVDGQGAIAVNVNGAAAPAGALTFGISVQVVYNGTTFDLISSGDPGSFGALLALNNLSDVQSASSSRSNLGLGTAAVQNIDTSGGTLGLLNSNKTDSGNNTFSGTNNFTGDLDIGGTAVTLPVPISIGGTGSQNTSDALQTLSGVYNASSCGNATKPSWCSGSDVGAWVNSAISHAAGQNAYILIDETQSPYTQTTSIVRPPNIHLACNGAQLNWGSSSGVQLIVGTASASAWDQGGDYDCHFVYPSGYTSGNTNIGVYFGGDPAGVISTNTLVAGGVSEHNIEITGFFHGIAYGNNAFNLNLNVYMHANYENIFGAARVSQAITSFSISSNVVTINFASTPVFSGSQVVTLYNMVTATYLNGVPLTVASVGASSITANFTHANVGTTSDTGTAFYGPVNAGESMVVSGGSVSNSIGAYGLDLNSNLDEWTLSNSQCDYNATACAGSSLGTGLRLFWDSGTHIEANHAPLIILPATVTSYITGSGGMLWANASSGTDTGYISALSATDVVVLRDTNWGANHTVTNMVYTGDLTAINACISGKGSQGIQPTDAGSFVQNFPPFSCPQNSINVVGTVTASVYGESSIGAFLLQPQTPSASSFRNYLCDNCAFDGINWDTFSDGSNNGGWAIVGGTGGFTDFYEFDSTGSSSGLSIANATVIASHVGLRVKQAGIITPSLSIGNPTGSSTQENFPTSGNIVGTTDTQSVSNKTVTSSSVDSSPIGATTPSTGKFTSINDSGLSASRPVFTDGSENLTSAAPSLACTIASAATIDVGLSCPINGSFVTITGTTSVTALGSTASVGSSYFLYFPSTLTLTANFGGATSSESMSGTPIVSCQVIGSVGSWYCSNPLYSANAVIFPNGSLVLGGNLTINGSSLPSLGLFKAGTNSLGFSVNTSEAGRIDSSKRLLWGYTADQGGGELLQVNSGGFFNGKVTATNMLDSALSASSIIWSDGSKNLTSTATSQAQNAFYAAPSGSSGVPTFRSIAAADLPSGVSPVLSGTTASLGGSALLAGACTAGTVTVTGATSSMVATASPSSDPDSVLSTGIAIYAFVSSANTVTVRICAIVAVTPTATTYNVRVLQ